MFHREHTVLSSFFYFRRNAYTRYFGMHIGDDLEGIGHDQAERMAE